MMKSGIEMWGGALAGKRMAVELLAKISSCRLRLPSRFLTVGTRLSGIRTAIVLSPYADDPFLRPAVSLAPPRVSFAECMGYVFDFCAFFKNHSTTSALCAHPKRKKLTLGKKFKHFHGFLAPKGWFHFNRFFEQDIGFADENEPLVF